jgi:hypothetical protein
VKIFSFIIFTCITIFFILVNNPYFYPCKIEPTDAVCKAGKFHEITFLNAGKREIVTDRIVVLIDQLEAICSWNKIKLERGERGKCLTNINTSPGIHEVKIIPQSCNTLSFKVLCY